MANGTPPFPPSPQRADALYRAALDDSALGAWPAAVLLRLFRGALAEVDAPLAARAVDRALRRRNDAPRRWTPGLAFWRMSAERALRRRLAELEQADAATLAAVIQAALNQLEAGGGPGVRRRFFAALARDRLAGFIDAVNDAAAAGARTLVFVTSRTDYKPLREAKALRENGFRCFLVHLEPLPDFVRPLFEKSFAGLTQLPLSPLMLGGLVAALRPEIIHVHCAMWHYVLSGVVMDEAHDDTIVVCEYNDVTSFYSPYDHMVRYFPMDDVDLDLAMERRAMHEAGLLIHQYEPRMEASWRRRFGGSAPMVQFQPYPVAPWAATGVRPLSADDGVVRMVWAGQIPGRVSCPPETFDAFYLGEAVEKLLQQDFGVVAYQNPMFTCDFSDPNFAFYGDLAGRFPRFSIRSGVRVDRLGRELAQYDFGIILFDFDYARAVSTREKNETVFANKLFTYLEGGIPVLVSAEYESMAAFVTEGGFGMAVPRNEIGSIRERVAAFDTEAARARIAAYQREHCVEREIARLIEAYDAAIVDRRQQRR